MSHPVVKMLGATLLVVATVFGAGCAATGDNDLLNDALTERKINRAIFEESSLEGSNIFVSCTDGVVTLSGSTDNALDKALAEQIVRDIDGVVDVNNLIQTT